MYYYPLVTKQGKGKAERKEQRQQEKERIKKEILPMQQDTLKGFGNGDAPSWVDLLGEPADCTPVRPSFSDSILFKGGSVVTLGETLPLLEESGLSSVNKKTQ